MKPKTQGIVALVLGAFFLILSYTNSDARGRYADAFFALLATGMGMQRLAVKR